MSGMQSKKWSLFKMTKLKWRESNSNPFIIINLSMIMPKFAHYLILPPIILTARRTQLMNPIIMRVLKFITHRRTINLVSQWWSRLIRDACNKFYWISSQMRWSSLRREDKCQCFTRFTSLMASPIVKSRSKIPAWV